jgi:hypothetical protein
LIDGVLRNSTLDSLGGVVAVVDHLQVRGEHVHPLAERVDEVQADDVRLGADAGVRAVDGLHQADVPGRDVVGERPETDEQRQRRHQRDPQDLCARR